MKWFVNMLLVLLVNYCVQFAAGLVIGFIAIAGIFIEGALLDVINIVIVMLSTAVTIWFIRRNYKINVFSHLHFSRLNSKITLFCVLIGLTYSTVLEFVMGLLFYKLIGISRTAQEFGTNTMVGLVVYTVLVAPVCEELIMRVGMIEVGRRGTSARNAILVSSIIFGLLHTADIATITSIICLGYLLAVVFVKTKNILYPIIIHFVNNLLSITLNTLTQYNLGARNLFLMELGGVTFPAWWMIIVCFVVCLVSSYLLWQQFDHQNENRIDILR